ncbi:MAG: hypothetical protein AAGD05_03240 [Bacteroidota bacterium]
MENNYFDRQIKDALENLGSAYDPGSWELLQQKMMQDAGLSNGAEEEHLFDQSIRERLDAVEASYNPAHWTQMESRLENSLNHADLEDLEFDAQVYENLNDLRIPYNHAHWTLMSNRLDEEFSIRRKLYKYKVAEVGLMLLALFTLFQYLPLRQTASTAASMESPIVSEQSVSIEANAPNLADQLLTTTESTVAKDNQSLPTQPKATDRLPESSTPSVATTSAKIALDASQKNQQRANLVSANASPSTLVPTAEHTSIAKSKAVALPPSTATTAIPVSMAKSLDLPKQAMPFKQQRMPLISAFNLRPVATASTAQALIDLSSLQVNIPEKPRRTTAFCTVCTAEKPVTVRLGMFLSTDFNKIMTPEKTLTSYPDFILDPYQQITAGYGGGITLGFRHQKWELETGIAYARVSYEPRRTILTTGSFIRRNIQEEVFDAAFLNVLKIPLNINYTFNHFGKWHFYAVGGASVNVLALNHFNIRTSTIGEEAPQPEQVNLRNNYFGKQSSYDGLFEGGNFRSNSYFTANLGMGIERYLTSRWSIFMQPTYQHLIFQKGFGPNRDRFNSLSIQIGAKSTFN